MTVKEPGTGTKHYRKFVRMGLDSRPWEALRGQIYPGSDAFIERHSPRNRELKEIARASESGRAEAGKNLKRETIEEWFRHTTSMAIGSARSRRIWVCIMGYSQTDGKGGTREPKIGSNLYFRHSTPNALSPNRPSESSLDSP